MALTPTQKLAVLVQATEDPALFDDEVAVLLETSAVQDANGVAPTADGWTPTYDLNRGAAAGWRMKAGKVANRFDFGTDVSRFSRSQQHAHCLAMAQQYANKIMGTTEARTTADALIDPVVNA